jgi:hypothetical protein
MWGKRPAAVTIRFLAIQLTALIRPIWAYFDSAALVDISTLRSPWWCLLASAVVLYTK